MHSPHDKRRPRPISALPFAVKGEIPSAASLPVWSEDPLPMRTVFIGRAPKGGR